MEQCRGVQVAASIRCGDFDTTPRADLKRRLRALLRQEKLYTRSVYLQRQLLQSPQNKRRGTMECRNGMQGSRAIYSFRCRHGRTRQETVDVRIVTNPSDPVKLPCAQSSVGHRIRPSAGLREVQRNLAEGSGADDRGQCTSSVISVDMGSRIHERKSRFRANALTVKPELTAFGTVPSNCIGISDRSEICSGCTSRHRSVDTRAGEQALWDVSVVSSRDEENTLKVRAKRAKDNVPSCDGEHDCTGRKCIELHSICRDEFTEDSHKNGSVKPLSAACTANTATGNIQQERHTQEPFAFWGDVSSLRHLSGHCALTSKTQLKGQPRKAGALSLEQSPGRQEGSLCTTSEACSDAVQRPTMGGWPECVVSMLGPDIFNRLKEEPQLVHATSKASGMSLFHHMLRHPRKDDEQVLELFKCIYEDKPLKERVSLPSLTSLRCDKGQTLAFYAAAYGHAKCLKWILEQTGGKNNQRRFLEIRDKQGDTPLHYAVKGGHVDVIELLLSLVPDMLNQQRSNGQTPLFDAFERPAIVQLLLSRGADYSVRCNRGLTPLEAATDELRWKRQCLRRTSKALPRRLSITVNLLKKAELALTKASTGGLHGESLSTAGQISGPTRGSNPSN